MHRRRSILQIPLGLALYLRVALGPRILAEDRLEYRQEQYREENGRIEIRTQAIGFEKELAARITAKGLLVYDGISGATPTGEAPPASGAGLPLTRMKDARRAISLELGVNHGDQTTTPQLSFSEESDYVSRGLSLTHTIDFNQKNTTLVLGLAHDFDSVRGSSTRDWRRKETTDGMIGLNQLLGPKTVLSINGTLGLAEGYLNDPYRLVTFLLPDSPDPIFSDPGAVNPLAEARPSRRFKQTGYVSLTQFIEPLAASLEANYRIYHDDWGIWAHTISAEWHQKLGSRLTVTPLVRFYRQSAADFYGPSFRGVSFDAYASGTRVAFERGVFVAFEGDSEFPAPSQQAGYRILDVPARPAHFSSDYRLSEFDAWTFGVSARAKIGEHLTLDLAFKRYAMFGRDAVTPKAAYPSANVVTLGCGLWF